MASSSLSGVPHLLDSSSLGLPLLLGALVALALLLLCPRSLRARLAAELRWLAQSFSPPKGEDAGKRGRGASRLPASGSASARRLDTVVAEEIAKAAAAPPLDLSALCVEQRIGTGTQGVVWLGNDPTTRTRVALKQLKKGRLAARIKPGSVIKRPQKLSWMVEKEALRACGHHPFVTSLYAAFQDESHLYLALELGASGDLFCLLHATEEGRLPESQARFYTGCVGLALAHVHSKGFLYCDVKLENVVLAPNGYPRLCDFGLVHQLEAPVKPQTRRATGTAVCEWVSSAANELTGSLSEPPAAKEERVLRKCGTDQYQPPEVVEGRGRTRAADLWALGVLLHELLAGRSPFDDGNLETGKAQIYERIAAYAHGGHDAEVELMSELIHEDEVSLSTEGGDLLLGFLTANETERLGCGADGFAEVASHPWFKSLDWTALVRQQLAPPLVPAAATAAQHSDGEAGKAASDEAKPGADEQAAPAEQGAPEEGSASHELKEVDAFLSSQNERDAPYDEKLWKTAFGLFGPTVVNERLPSGAATDGARAEAAPCVKHLADVKDLAQVTHMQDVSELKKQLHQASEMHTQQVHRARPEETQPICLKGKMTCADALAAEEGASRAEPASHEHTSSTARRSNLFGGAKPGSAKLVALPDGAMAGAAHLSSAFEVVEGPNDECAVDVSEKVARRVSDVPSEASGQVERTIEETPRTVMDCV